MRILISGTSGFIGSRMARAFESQGFEVLRLVRRSPGVNEINWDPGNKIVDAKSIEGIDSVVHLASLPWTGKWTAEFKKRILENRISTNNLLAETLAGLRHKPQALICASGQGFYAPSGDEILSEDSPAGTDFIAQVQCAGEMATAHASAAGIRVVHLRLPTVVGGSSIRGGVSRMGSGRQWMSWVARDELPSIVEHIFRTEALVGAVNPVSPQPLRNAEFLAVVNRILHKRGFTMPTFLVRLLFGEMGEALILASRRLMPNKLLSTGYKFQFAELEPALRHEVAAAN